ncbi:unnamed protein product [Coregonus sp. 'balchen']|nr:unnamed protein product [Coregonus sp. 'balchen']
MGAHPVYPPLPSFLLLLSILLLLPHPATSSSHSKPQVVERASVSGTPSPPSGNSTGGKRACTDKVMCRPGIVLPVWLPLSPPLAEQTGRAIVYFACLMYMFLGVSIIADRFMASIEVITSQEKEVTITKPNGETSVTTVRIWNETVSNLTLMALGSSAPEILLLSHPVHPPLPSFLLLLSILLLLPHPATSSSHSKPQVVERASVSGTPSPPSGNSTGGKRACTDKVMCRPGIVLPVWLPLSPPLAEQTGRAIVYFACLMYMFLGVSIIADRFMASIEVITSQEKEVTITKPNGETSVTTVRIWNETVSNLTLMALGSSAPEILLSVIEVCGHNFDAGELGPGTIVGSAAFNMFVIIGVCVWVIPDGESRKIKHLRVFFITAFWSIFAYIWLYLILAVISPGVVEVWEALVTLLYFPVCVILAWIADRRLLFYKYMHKRYRADKQHGIVVETEGDLAPKGIDVIMDAKFSDGNSTTGNSSSVCTVSVQTGKELDQNRDEVVRILKDLKQKHPDKDLEQLIEMANYSALVQQRKSRAFYRIQATRMMIGAGNEPYLAALRTGVLDRRTGVLDLRTGLLDDLRTGLLDLERAGDPDLLCKDNTLGIC